MTKRPNSRRLSAEETFWGWVLVTPTILGLILFKVGPVLASLALSFTDYDIISPPKWAGTSNFTMLVRDKYWIKSVGVTLNYILLFIPLSLTIAYGIALLMSQNVRRISIYRTMWYLPSLVPGVASAVVWRWA